MLPVNPGAINQALLDETWTKLGLNGRVDPIAGGLK
jgi:hypothetical protein